ncbi:MAG TPA: ATP-binding protein, partial [Gammaproteobacteria bacterium]|nr:ATP-binding protein [Gammaproteobacteria bacterium]
LFEHLCSDFEPQALEKGLKLVFVPCTETAYTDPELLRRLLSNLISNAIRYTNEGEVRVTCTPQDSKLRIDVGDTGIGISADERSRIFEEFYQVDRGTRRPEGLGLGLSIVRRLADLLHYSLDLESTPGQGTFFSITVLRGELALPAAQSPRSPPTHLTGRILVVDDEPAVAHATSLLLELEGFEVRIASCEREAIEHALNGAPDLIVSDYHLRGGETGIAVVTAVRQRLGSTIPVVFMTGDTSRAAITQSKIQKARLLNKPIRGDELLAIVQDEIAAYRA